MPVSATPVDSTLVVLVQTGTDGEGNPVYRSLRYASLKPSATDQDAYDVGAAVAGLVAYPLAEVRRQTLSSLISA
ncbi:MAG: DUF1659 domain-containing protein [Clostridia bacterium]|jgi:hypothetical protein|nr:DUF1659 domain-containing protein [Clostridia bacterium]MDH7574051.1 DUF1659 domain-containing protein [Clostridia bacterium]